MTERLLNDQVVGQIREAFNNLKEPVEILFFGRKEDCDYCDDTRQLAQEIAEISELLTLKVYDLDDDAEIAGKYRIDKAPGMVLLGRDAQKTGNNGGESQDYGVRFAGIPSGYEFSSFIQDLLLVSGRDSGLRPETRAFLKELRQPVLLQVFVTPT
jgi:alkyl hydroperoxide reductase subunit AhpF